jgi:hypothetical protein
LKWPTNSQLLSRELGDYWKYFDLMQNCDEGAAKGGGIRRNGGEGGEWEERGEEERIRQGED